MGAAAKHTLASAILLAALIPCASQIALNQDTANREHPRSFEAELPVRAIYPFLARQARITGDVRVRVDLRPDGSVVSAEVVDGPPMLREAAVTSAKESKFSCWPDCADAITTAVITYTYGTRSGSCCCDTVHQRSWKCLNLWKCGKWKSVLGPPPTVGTAENRVIILADPACVETESAGRAQAMR